MNNKNIHYAADPRLTQNKELLQQLKEDGWSGKTVNISQPRRNWEKPTKFFVLSREIDNPKADQTDEPFSEGDPFSEFDDLDELEEENYGESVTEIKTVTNDSLEYTLHKAVFDGVENHYCRHKDNSTPDLQVRTAYQEADSHDADDDSADSAFYQMRFEDIPSLKLIRSDKPEIILALDCEWYTVTKKKKAIRYILSYQIAFITPDKPDKIQQLIFLPLAYKRLGIGFVLSYILETYNWDGLFSGEDSRLISPDYRQTRRYVYHTVSKKGKVKVNVTPNFTDAVKYAQLDGEVEALRAGRTTRCESNDVNADGVPIVNRKKIVSGYINDFTDFNKEAIPVTVLCHAGRGDLSALDFHGFDDVMPRLSQVQGGLVSLSSFYFHPSSVKKYWQFHPIRLTFRDSMCFAPANKKSLESLGDAVGVPKIHIETDQIEHMNEFMLDDPIGFMRYAINDSVVALTYTSELFGINRHLPVTANGGAAVVARSAICEYLDVSPDTWYEDYNTVFRGLKRVKGGKKMIGSEERSSYIDNTSLVPVSHSARRVQNMAELAYRGGYNACFKVGYYDGITYDFDLENAYPSLMSLVVDVDWLAEDVIQHVISKRYLTLDDFKGPFDPVFGCVTFEFPDDCKFPCLPYSVSNSMVMPLTSDHTIGCYCCGCEMYLALKMGAKVYAEEVFICKPRHNPDGSLSKSLSSAVQQLIRDRRTAEKVWGKNSVPAQLLKLLVNGLYGKLCQNIIEKDTWDAFREKMVSVGGSAITSPAHGAMITAGVRCVLLAAMYQLDQLGYQVFCCTTDGFITDAPKEVLDGLDLFGFSDLFRDGRELLTGKRDMWSLKHQQDHLLVFTTRGNVALNSDGVCAHNSYVSSYKKGDRLILFEKDSFSDRFCLMDAVLSRTDRVASMNKKWTTFRRLSSRFDRPDFHVSDITRNLSMDFDMKRMPVKDSFSEVHPVLFGHEYTIANFDTRAYHDVNQFVVFKETAAPCEAFPCLRTLADWEPFWVKVSKRSDGIMRVHLNDLDWSRIFTIVMGYRLGYWDIPHLRSLETVKDKVAWIQLFNKSDRAFSVNTWKNCGRKNRSSQMIHKYYVEDLLTEMQNYSPD